MPQRPTHFEVRRVPADYQHLKNNPNDYTDVFVASIKEHGYAATVAKLDVPSIYFGLPDDKDSNDSDVSEDATDGSDDEDDEDGGEYIELFSGYEKKLAIALEQMNDPDAENVDIDFPDPRDYMLVGVPHEERTHYMMFGTAYLEDNAGSPISPVCESKQVLLTWLTLNPLCSNDRTNWEKIVFGKEKEEEA